ncbi:MAG: ABC transporter permease [Rubrivivax sp.]
MTGPTTGSTHSPRRAGRCSPTGPSSGSSAGATRAPAAGAAAGQPAGGFLSFISAVSVLGIALGVAALIIVLSVMNGFQKEVRDRMLAAVAHIELQAANGEALPDWRAVAALAAHHPQVRGSAPFVAAQALLAHDDALRAARCAASTPPRKRTSRRWPGASASSSRPCSRVPGRSSSAASWRERSACASATR